MTIEPTAGQLPDLDTSPSTEPDASTAPRPTLCRMVLYVNPQIPDSEHAALVVGTLDNVTPGDGIATPTDDMHVHLRVSPPIGSTYIVEDVPYGPDNTPGTWHWSARVAD